MVERGAVQRIGLREQAPGLVVGHGRGVAARIGHDHRPIGAVVTRGDRLAQGVDHGNAAAGLVVDVRGNVGIGVDCRLQPAGHVVNVGGRVAQGVDHRLLQAVGVVRSRGAIAQGVDRDVGTPGVIVQQRRGVAVGVDLHDHLAVQVVDRALDPAGRILRGNLPAHRVVAVRRQEPQGINLGLHQAGRNANVLRHAEPAAAETVHGCRAGARRLIDAHAYLAPGERRVVRRHPEGVVQVGGQLPADGTQADVVRHVGQGRNCRLGQSRLNVAEHLVDRERGVASGRERGVVKVIGVLEAGHHANLGARRRVQRALRRRQRVAGRWIRNNHPGCRTRRQLQLIEGVDDPASRGLSPLAEAAHRLRQPAHLVGCVQQLPGKIVSPVAPRRVRLQQRRDVAHRVVDRGR